ncbi:Abi family protein [Curtobacterium sp. SAFR-003]|uniref:Abi family protein n=1 Tax=Curtobacterium sp. SAFR-003 TaxID=3387276 RepID=UPI003F80C639
MLSLVAEAGATLVPLQHHDRPARLTARADFLVPGGDEVPYTKPWLSIDDQIGILRRRGLVIPDVERAAAVLHEVGYYRLTGYLYPLRQSHTVIDERGRASVVVEEQYRVTARFDHACELIAFDRALRLLVLEAVERVEVAIRTRLAHVLGRLSPFAHEDPAAFSAAFTASGSDPDRRSEHQRWLGRLEDRKGRSDESFVTHFRDRYDGHMPVWVVVELLELGQVSRLYGGLRNDLATEVAAAFSVPTKQLMRSWLASVNYVRNVAAHHSRLFNRKLVVAPKRPTAAQVPALAHLGSGSAPKRFGVYEVLAVLAHLLDAVPSDEDWQVRTAALLSSFPDIDGIDVGSTGADPAWLQEPLWNLRQTRAV